MSAPHAPERLHRQAPMPEAQSVPSLWQRFTQGLRQTRARWRQRLRRREAARQLREMDEHGLRDLGLGRGELVYWLDQEAPPASASQSAPESAHHEEPQAPSPDHQFATGRPLLRPAQL